MKTKKSQSTIEFIIVVSIAFMLLIPAMLMFFEFTRESGDTLIDSQVAFIGDKIIKNAKTVYNFGEHSKITIDVDFPEGVQGMSILNNKELVIVVSLSTGIKDKSFIMPKNINITGAFDESDYSPGRKEIKIENIDGTNILLQRLK